MSKSGATPPSREPFFTIIASTISRCAAGGGRGPAPFEHQLEDAQHLQLCHVPSTRHIALVSANPQPDSLQPLAAKLALGTAPITLGVFAETYPFLEQPSLLERAAAVQTGSDVVGKPPVGVQE